VIAHALLLGAVIVGVIYRHPTTFQWIALLGGLWIFRSLFTAQFEYWCSVQASAIKDELRAVISSTLDRIEPIAPSELSAVLIKGLNSLDIYLGRFLPQMLNASVIPVAVIATLFFLDPLSAVIAILTIPLIPFFGALIGRYTQDAVAQKWKTLGSLSRYFEDSLQGFITLRIFGRHRSQGERIQKMGDQYTEETMKVLKVSFLSALVLELAATISVALIAVSVGLRLVDGKISFIHGLSVLILAPEVYFPLRNAASLFHASADGSEILERVREIEATSTPVVDQSQREFKESRSIRWDSWTLSIPGVAQSKIETNEVKRGEALYISGESGIGKSTFAENLLCNNFDTSIYIDGEEVLPQHVCSYQENLGWIPQLPRLAPGTIRDQFILVQPGISDSEIENALEELALPLSELPLGLDTHVGSGDEKSSQLSGGQLRKIAVARALTRKPFLIVADEPTADLDSVSASVIMRALDRAVKNGAALICITHHAETNSDESRMVSVERVITA
jgi:ATP-binding cassette subfamily C protein CydD